MQHHYTPIRKVTHTKYWLMQRNWNCRKLLVEIWNGEIIWENSGSSLESKHILTYNVVNSFIGINPREMKAFKSIQRLSHKCLQKLYLWDLYIHTMEHYSAIKKKCINMDLKIIMPREKI